MQMINWELGECRNYIELLQNLPMHHNENIKVQNIMCYLQDDYSSVIYEEKFFKDLFLDSEDEKKSFYFHKWWKISPGIVVF